MFSKPKSMPVVLSALCAVIALLLCTQQVCAQTIVVDRNPLNFGNVGPNQHAVKTLTVQNTGTAPLFVIFDPLPNPPFDVDSHGFRLLPSQQRTFTVSFHPTTLGQYHDVLSIGHNDLSAETIVIPLQGESIVPSYTMSCIVSYQTPPGVPPEFIVGECNGFTRDLNAWDGDATFRIDQFDANTDEVVWDDPRCGVKSFVCSTYVRAMQFVTRTATVKHYLPNGSYISTDVSATAHWENGM